MKWNIILITVTIMAIAISNSLQLPKQEKEILLAAKAVKVDKLDKKKAKIKRVAKKEISNRKIVKEVALKKVKINESEIYLLAQIIHSEAKGEPYEGKIAVGNVVLNRVKSNQFPNSIKGVIYQKGQFQPVSNGSINNKPSDESIKAARESYEKNLVGEALYFYNPKLTNDSWIRTRKVINKIGNHNFAI